MSSPTRVWLKSKPARSRCAGKRAIFKRNAAIRRCASANFFKSVLLSIKDHGPDLAEVACVSDAPMITVEDEREHYGEQRLQSLGWFRNRMAFLVWTERNDSTRVISCRYGDKHETCAYFEALDL